MLDQVVHQWIGNGDESVNRVVQDFKFVDVTHVAWNFEEQRYGIWVQGARGKGQGSGFRVQGFTTLNLVP